MLEVLREELAAGYRDGLAREDFVRQPCVERLALLRRELESLLAQRAAVQEQALHVVYQRAEKIRQRRAAIRHRQIHLRGKRVAGAVHICREIKITHQAVH